MTLKVINKVREEEKDSKKLQIIFLIKKYDFGKINDFFSCAVFSQVTKKSKASKLVEVPLEDITQLPKLTSRSSLESDEFESRFFASYPRRILFIRHLKPFKTTLS